MRIVALALLILLFARTASAHQIGLSRGEYRLHGNEVDAELVFSKSETAGIPLESALREGVHVRGDGAECKPEWKGSEPVEEDGLRARMHFSCASAKDLAVRIDFFDRFPKGHEHLVSITGDMQAEVIAEADHREVKAGEPKGALALFWIGVKHILTGWDHLAFLLGLILVRGHLKSLIGAVTAFTVAHSITLGLAVFDVVRVSPAVVEPAIALSVVYVGVENFFLKANVGRWRITFPFGLVHGFGFASALHALEVPRKEIPTALFSFNMGVEAGQLGVLAIVFPIIVLFSRSDLFRKWGVRLVSGAIAAAGLVWFVSRL